MTVELPDGSSLQLREAGQGDPVIFVHGLMSDARVWTRQLDAFATKGFRAIAYSRRFSYPNQNRPISNYSAEVDAKDLANLLTELNIPRAHIVAHSYGAYSALLLATRHPDRILSLTLAEPPLVTWLNELQQVGSELAKQEYKALFETFIEPAKKAAEADNDETVLQIFFDYFAGPGKFVRLPPPVVSNARQNLPELKSFLTSDNRYPAIDRTILRAIDFPVLVMSGGDSKSVARHTDRELVKWLPEMTTRRSVIEGASHLMWIERPVECRNAVLDFIASSQDKE